MTEVRGRWFAAACAVSALTALTLKQPASALPAGPVLHEPIAPNPGEDIAMHVVLSGNLPAAIQTPKGGLAAPDPQALPAASDAAYGYGTEHERFQPDRDTSRPEVSAYDDPFTPATAPFKRLAAFDAVRADYTLYVREPRLVPLPINGTAASGEDIFFADEIVDLAADQPARIPSVGPGARIVRARLGVGARDIPFRIMRNGADNWFAEAASMKAPTRARLVLELTIARSSLGGPLADPTWDELPLVAPLPDNVARDAAIVTAALGVSRQMRPRQVVAILVRYFRAFTESNETPPARDGVYLDLALSKKGVCRHRAFAFLVTAQSLGIPTRMVVNEAHAWVEVHDGTLWHLIDLGGAGQLDTRADPLTDRIAYEPPADTFPWPPGADRGDAMNQGAHGASAHASSRPRDANPPSTGGSPTAEGMESAEEGAAIESAASSGSSDDRPPSFVTLALSDREARRGRPLRMRGSVTSDGEPCPHVAVDVLFRDGESRRLLFLGTLATNDDGAFAGAIVVPASIPLADYDVVARTTGDTRCGAGTN